jgi:hypothetical protein
MNNSENDSASHFSANSGSSSSNSNGGASLNGSSSSAASSGSKNFAKLLKYFKVFQRNGASGDWNKYLYYNQILDYFNK